MSLFSVELDDVQRWVSKGILVWKLNAKDGAAPSSWKDAVKSLTVGFVVATIVEFIVVFLFQRDLKYGGIFGFPLFGVSIVTSSAAFLSILLALLRVSRVPIKPHVAFSLGCYVLSGAVPVLTLLLHAQLAEAIQLFVVHQDPSLPYFAAATFKMILPDQASPFAILRAWFFVLAEVFTGCWYLIWNLRRVLVASLDGAIGKNRTTISILMALALNFLLFRFYAGRLYWRILGRLIL
jgi:hypothetical protein